MPAYHSQFIDSPQQVGNMALLPLKTSIKGPAPRISASGGDQRHVMKDIIDEALEYFKANIFFRNYEIKSAADRTLIYVTLYVSECLRKLQRCPDRNSAQKELTTMSLSKSFPIPGESGFPLNAMFRAPTSGGEEDTMRSYLQQLRQETNLRLIEKVYEAGAPSKVITFQWWLCFARKRFMDKTLLAPGATL